MNSVQFDFACLEEDHRLPGGLTLDRFQSDWTVGHERFRVSSVSNRYTTETMIFRIDEDGEVNYLDLCSDRFWRCTEDEHQEFLSEYLENRTQEG